MEAFAASSVMFSEYTVYEDTAGAARRTWAKERTDGTNFQPVVDRLGQTIVQLNLWL